MTKFEAFVLEHFIKHKPLIFEECNVNFLDEEKKSPASMNKTKSITKYYYFTSPFFKKLVIIHENIYNLVLKKKIRQNGMNKIFMYVSNFRKILNDKKLHT